MSKQRSCKYLTVVIAATLLLAGCFGDSPEQFLAEAKKDIERKDGSAAIIQLKNALQKNPSLSEARFLLGQLLLENGDVEGAAIELGKASELGFPVDQLAPKLAQALLMRGQFEKVIAEYGQTKLQTPKDMAELQASVASAYMALGKLSLALQSAESAVAIDGDNVRAQLIRVRLMASSDGVAPALSDLEAVIKRSPNNAEAWQLKGELLGVSDKIEPAIEAFRRSIQLDGRNISPHVGVLTLLLAKKDLDGATKQLEVLHAVKPKHPQTLYFTAALALEKNDLKTALERAQVLLNAAPEDVRVLYLAGAIEYQRASLLQAVDHLNKALSKAPTNAKVRVLLAQSYARAGDAAKAVSVLQPLLGEHSVSIDAMSIAAEAYLQQGDNKRAEYYFSKVAKLDPEDARSRTVLAVSKISKGSVDQGLADLQSISEINSRVTADLALINTYVQKGDLERALKAIDVLEAKAPGKPIGANLRGQVELARGNKDKARQAFEAALKIDAAFYPAAASLAGLDWDAKQPDAAIARFQKIVSAEPKHLLANMSIVALRERGGASKEELADMLGKLVKLMPNEVTPRLNLVLVQLARRDHKLALAAAQEAVVALPEKVEVWQLLGMVHVEAGDFNQAGIAFNKVIAMQPNMPEPYLRLAEMYIAKKDRAAAIQNLRRAIGVKADFLPAQTKLLSLELAGGNFDQAQVIAKSMQTQHPSDSVGFALAGDVEAAQKNWSAASSNYRLALARRPTLELAKKLHQALLNASKAAEGKQFETEWLAKNPGDFGFVAYLGDAALARKDYGLAEQRYLAVLKLKPDHVQASNNVAWLLHQAKKPGALEHAERANKLMPNQPPLLDTMAEIHAEGGRLDRAIELQKQAVDLAPELANNRYRLAKYYLAAGQKARAFEELNKLAELGDKFNQQAEVRKLLMTP